MANAQLPPEILVVDDDSTVGQSVEGALASQYSIEVTNCQDLETSNYHFNNQDYPVVFVELEFEPLHGLALIQQYRNHDALEKRATAFVIMSGKDRSQSDDVLLKELLDVEVIAKPFTMVKMLPYLSRGMATHARLHKYEKIRKKLTDMVKAGEADAALNQVKSLLGELGQKGVQLLVEVYENAGQLEEALSFITPIADKDPIPFYLYLKGHILRLLGRFDEAREILEKLHKDAPLHLSRMGDLGEVYLQLNEADKAAAVIKSLIQVTPEEEDKKFKWFERLDAAGHLEQARQLCKETTKPMDVVRHYNNSGVQLAKKGDIPGAIEEYKRALRLYPKFKENYRIHYNIALAQIKLKNRASLDAATEQLRMALSLRPDFEKAQSTLESVQKILSGKKAG